MELGADDNLLPDPESFDVLDVVEELNGNFGVVTELLVDLRDGVKDVLELEKLGFRLPDNLVVTDETFDIIQSNIVQHH